MGDAADEAKDLRTGVDKTVLRVPGHVDRVVGGQFPFAVLPAKLAASGEYERLVLPPVGMKGCRSAWLHFKYSHSEVGGAVLGGDNPVEGYAWGLGVWSNVSIVADLHVAADSFRSAWLCYPS